MLFSLHFTISIYNEGKYAIFSTLCLAGNVIEDVPEIWVTTTEAAELTGYNPGALQRLALKLWKQEESERPIKMLFRSRRYEFWLPDLIAYIGTPRHGPQPKRNQQN